MGCEHFHKVFLRVPQGALYFPVPPGAHSCYPADAPRAHTPRREVATPGRRLGRRVARAPYTGMRKQNRRPAVEILVRTATRLEALPADGISRGAVAASMLVTRGGYVGRPAFVVLPPNRSRNTHSSAVIANKRHLLLPQILSNHGLLIPLLTGDPNPTKPEPLYGARRHSQNRGNFGQREQRLYEPVVLLIDLPVARISGHLRHQRLRKGPGLGKSLVRLGKHFGRRAKLLGDLVQNPS